MLSMNDIMWSGMSPWSVGVSWGPAVSPLSFLCPLSLLADVVVWEAERALTLCEPCSAITRTSLNYQHCSQHESETRPRSSSYEEN